MFTRCPQCKTVHPITAASLSHSRGLVQCGLCGRSFSALSFLFDEWPAGQAHGPAKGANVVPPVLVLDAKTAAANKEEAAENKKHDEQVNKPGHMAWRLATALLILLTIANISWTFRGPLMENSRISTLVNQVDSSEIEQEGLLKAPKKIQLVSRDMHTHPTRSGILVLSLTFVNLAPDIQEYPDLEITLMDTASQPVARRRLLPRDYLRSGADISAGIATDVYLPVLLELGDPGEQAVGFEIQFL